MLIADTANYLVREVNSAGTISTVAGNGIYALPAATGPALSEGVGSVSGLAVDGLGDVYIVNEQENMVVKLTNGVITPLAGGGFPGYSGDGGPAVSAQLSSPYGVAVDGAGNLFISDSGNSVIRRISPDGIITTFAGNGIAGYSGDGGPATSAELAFPGGLCVDAAGDVFIADTSNGRVRKISAQTGLITTVTGGGSAEGDGGPAINAESIQWMSR